MHNNTQDTIYIKFLSTQIVLKVLTLCCYALLKKPLYYAAAYYHIHTFNIATLLALNVLFSYSPWPNYSVA